MRVDDYMNTFASEDREILLEEYKILCDSIYRRSATMQTIHSILLPSSIIIVTIAVEFQESLNAISFFHINVSGFLPLFSVMLLLVSLFFSFTTSKTNRICWSRVHEIEKILGIKGHRYVYSKIQNTLWWKIKRPLWQALLILAIAICIVSSVYLFL